MTTVILEERTKGNPYVCLIDVFNKKAYSDITTEDGKHGLKTFCECLDEQRADGIPYHYAIPQHDMSALIFDVDIEEEPPLRPLYTLSDVKRLFELVVAFIRENATLVYPKSPFTETIRALFLSKVPRMKGTKVKHGFHLEFTFLIFEKKDRITIRQAVQTQYHLKLDPIESTPWLLLGASKDPHSLAYAPDKTFFARRNGKILCCKPSQKKTEDTLPFHKFWKPNEKTELILRAKRVAPTIPIVYKPNGDITDEIEEIINEWLEENDQGSNYQLTGSRLTRLAPSPCLVDPRNNHDNDNAYIIVKDNIPFVGCYRKCKYYNRSLRPLIPLRLGERLLQGAKECSSARETSCTCSSDDDTKSTQ